MIPATLKQHATLLAIVEPMGAVRTTQRQKWVDKNAQRYHDYKNRIAWSFKAQWKQPIEKPCMVSIKFHMPIPQSWSEKKRRAAIGQPHTSKPDIDNLVKGVFDASNGIVWADDRFVYEVSAHKSYSDKPRIELTVMEVGV